MTKSTKSKTSPIEIIRPPLSRTFDVPNPDDLLKVFEGDHVKLIFKGDEDVERMWVNVTVTQAGKMDHWAGTLDNDPVTEGVFNRISHGDVIHFHPYDVIDIDLHGALDQREKNGESNIGFLNLRTKAVDLQELTWQKNETINHQPDRMGQSLPQQTPGDYWDGAPSHHRGPLPTGSPKDRRCRYRTCISSPCHPMRRTTTPVEKVWGKAKYSLMNTVFDSFEDMKAAFAAFITSRTFTSLTL